MSSWITVERRIQTAHTILPVDESSSPLFSPAVRDVALEILLFLDLKDVANLQCCRFLYHTMKIEEWILRVPEEKLMACLKIALKISKIESRERLENLIDLVLNRNLPLTGKNYVPLLAFLVIGLQEKYIKRQHLTPKQYDLLGRLTWLCAQNGIFTKFSLLGEITRSFNPDTGCDLPQNTFWNFLEARELAYKHRLSYPIMLAAAKSKNEHVMRYFMPTIISPSFSACVSKLLKQKSSLDPETYRFFFEHLLTRLHVIKEEFTRFSEEREELGGVFKKRFNADTAPDILTIYQIAFPPTEGNTKLLARCKDLENVTEVRLRCLCLAFAIATVAFVLFEIGALGLWILPAGFALISLLTHSIKPCKESYNLKDAMLLAGEAAVQPLIYAGIFFAALTGCLYPDFGRKAIHNLTQGYALLTKNIFNDQRALSNSSKWWKWLNQNLYDPMITVKNQRLYLGNQQGKISVDLNKGAV
jgi:hypothetical protein